MKKHTAKHTGKAKALKTVLPSVKGKKKSGGSFGHAVEKGHPSHEMDGLGSGFEPPMSYECGPEGQNESCS